MYKDYFGFIEAPFSIVPNAKYLFLSTRHREALAHLQAGLGEGGGFAMLTGEVGTGKTTVSKAMLASIGSDIEARLILNPTFSETDLLEAICDEFAIGYPENASLKQLNKVIFSYLHSNHDKGKQTLLLIDEAQHLSAGVLEQLRLLTNLETDSQKLLKVLLIGQPELQANLQTEQLRQLAQRITGRYHLLPLTEQEIEQYIHFRTKTAGVESQLFSKKVVRIVAKQTGGVPRLINLVCDKALQYACYNGEKTVTASVAEKACEDVMSFQAPSFSRGKIQKEKASPLPAYAALAGIALLIGSYKFAPQIQSYTEVQLEPIPVVQNIEQPQATSSDDLQQFMQRSSSEVEAIQTLYRLWGMEAGAREANCNSEFKVPFQCEQVVGQLEDIKANGRPVVLNLSENGRSFYAVLYAVYQDKAELLNQSERIQVPVSWLESVWNGSYTTLWYNEVDRTLRFGSTGESVKVLDTLLANALNEPLLEEETFGDRMYQRVRIFQLWQGLEADGVVGTQTLRLLDLVANQSAPELKIYPHNEQEGI
ncbi:AAA family ATPase [Vibrio sp. HN007]|uniref:AAA family ATPase n=1 Tax=Vibrio iocasae TaxID=3098914 RepID=UPI0035D4FFBB